MGSRVGTWELGLDHNNGSALQRCVQQSDRFDLRMEKGKSHITISVLWWNFVCMCTRLRGEESHLGPKDYMRPFSVFFPLLFFLLSDVLYKRPLQ